MKHNHVSSSPLGSTTHPPYRKCPFNFCFVEVEKSLCIFMISDMIIYISNPPVVNVGAFRRALLSIIIKWWEIYALAWPYFQEPVGTRCRQLGYLQLALLIPGR